MRLPLLQWERLLLGQADAQSGPLTEREHLSEQELLSIAQKPATEADESSTLDESAQVDEPASGGTLADSSEADDERTRPGILMRVSDLDDALHHFDAQAFSVDHLPSLEFSCCNFSDAARVSFVVSDQDAHSKAHWFDEGAATWFRRGGWNQPTHGAFSVQKTRRD